MLMLTLLKLGLLMLVTIEAIAAQRDVTATEAFGRVQARCDCDLCSSGQSTYCALQTDAGAHFLNFHSH